MNIRGLSILGIWLTLLAVGWPLQGAEVTVQVENLAPTGGVFLSPMWVGFDDGQFELSTDTDAIGLALLAQNGDVAVLQKEFRTAAPEGVDGVIQASTVWPSSPFFGPGTSGTQTFTLDPATDRFMNYASKVFPSTAAFIASNTPIEIFDDQGAFLGKQIITILGTEVQEVGTLTSGTTATGTRNQPARGVLTATDIVDRSTLTQTLRLVHDGVTLTGKNTSTVARFDATALDLDLPNTAVARITVVPEPATVILLAGGSLVLLRRRRQTHRQ